MDNKYYHRGSGEVVELNGAQFGRPDHWNTESEKEHNDAYDAFLNHIASLPAIGSIDPSYPVGWVGDDVEMVWQVRIRKSMEWFNTEKEIYDKWLKEIYDKWLTDGAKEDLRRILFLPVNKVTVKSERQVDLSGVEFVQPDYTKEAEERIYPTYEQSGGGKNWDEMTELEQAYYNLRKAYNAFDVTKNTYLRVRQQSAAEIDRLRGEVERLKALAPLAILSGMQHGFALDRDKLFIEHCMAGKYDEVVKIWKTENNIQ